MARFLTSILDNSLNCYLHIKNNLSNIEQIDILPETIVTDEDIKLVQPMSLIKKSFSTFSQLPSNWRLKNYPPKLPGEEEDESELQNISESNDSKGIRIYLTKSRFPN